MTNSNTEPQPLRALIYCRVSSKKQATDGHGLDSQELRCREYAENNGYEVEAVFPDDVTGGGDFMNRPGMVALLTYIDAQADKKFVVIFDDLKRFARDTEFHIRLRRAFKERDTKVECLNFKLEDTPEGKFIEIILAAQGELERVQNGRQVTQKMKARMMNGYWVFTKPYGYKYIKTKDQGNIVIRDEPLASTIQNALEGYASGRFDSQAEVRRFLNTCPEYPKNQYGLVSYQSVTDILTRPFYAGYLSSPEWDINMVKGRHEPLISLQTFEVIQQRRAGATLAPSRPDTNVDFPLRGFVLCGDCNYPYTANWSQGKTKKYPYYICGKRGCDSYRKSIPRAKIEDGFDDIVRNLQPTQSLFTLAKDMFKSAWKQRTGQTEELLSNIRLDMKKAEKQIEGFVDRIMESTSPAVISAYEKKINKLELKRCGMEEKLQIEAVSDKRRDDFIELSLQFLANPWNLWATGQFTLKRMVLRLAFSERITYDRNKGYRTPKTSLPFKVLEGICTPQKEVVPPPRVELGTY